MANEEEINASGRELLSNEELSDVNGGVGNVWDRKKSAHRCPFCGNPTLFEDWEWERMAPTRGIRCDKCRNSYPKLRWDPESARI